jgi:hypothetical protein
MKAVLVVACLLISVSTVAADDPPSLRRAITVYAFAAAADKATTVYGLHVCATCVESNPLYSWSGNDATTIAVSTAVDIASIWAWQRFVGRKYPRLATIGLYGWSGVRVGLAVHNVRLAQRRK